MGASNEAGRIGIRRHCGCAALFGPVHGADVEFGFVVEGTLRQYARRNGALVDAYAMARQLSRSAGLLVGISAAAAVVGCLKIARELPLRRDQEAVIVTILCDSGNRYQSKLFNPEFMRSKKLPVPEWLEKRPKFDVPFV